MDKMDNNYFKQDYILKVVSEGGPTIGKYETWKSFL